MNQRTIGETVDEIRNALSDYIEATYHVGHPALVAQRQVLLAREGIIFRSPYLESTPRYEAGRRFEDLGLPQAATALLAMLSEAEPPLLHNPPYVHQAAALEESIGAGRNLVITTGTGSGKTESFLLPILSRLAIEAHDAPHSFRTPAVRAILLYPMNALVNDQLGRLRLLLGSNLVATQFMSWSGRPARFARYTSRTLYPGVRTARKDQNKLRPVEDFYLSLVERAADPSHADSASAAALIENLQSRGKWPAKPDLVAWYGAKGTRWTTPDGHFARAVTGPMDTELLTRHEALATPPDVLVTNYSMLEYMLMRPLERPLFDATRSWLAANPDQRIILVVDEAHLYRGAAGAEVSLLLRRLRSRLGIDENRLQVICTSASFANADHAVAFGAQLTGTPVAQFRTIAGRLALRQPEGTGGQADVDALLKVDLNSFYAASDGSGRIDATSSFLTYRGVTPDGDIASTLHTALYEFPPLNLLVNLTMPEAIPVDELAARVFPDIAREHAERALSVLTALGSVARRSSTEPGLLPCRVHGFFRGLPGLWACIDPDCEQRANDYEGSPVGQLFDQPRDTCECGSRVFELYTCRNCGSAYARAYTNNVATPEFLWSEPGRSFQSASGYVAELLPIDLLLEEPSPGEQVEPADLDLLTGRLNPLALGDRTRQVFLRLDRTADANDQDNADSRVNPSQAGEFRPCGVCGQEAPFGHSSVQDHQTKGDEPFQALVTRQLEVQPPGAQGYSDFAPLRGRKVLAFSDSRQTAARLAPNLQTYSMRDALRPAILRGWKTLEQFPAIRALLTLEDLYLACVLGARTLGIRLRPELRGTESLQLLRDVAAATDSGALDDQILELFTNARSETPPQSLLRGITATLTHRYFGLQSLALASISARTSLESRFKALPALVPNIVTDEQKVALANKWIARWTTIGIWFQGMDAGWLGTRGGVRSHSGRFRKLQAYLGSRENIRVFESKWLPVLLEALCEPLGAGQYRMRAAMLRLELDGPWAYCLACRTTQRPVPGVSLCESCGRPSVQSLDPDRDIVFTARKGYYRSSSLRSLAEPPEAPMAIIAAEHTAQLNSSTPTQVFSKAEEHELLFQDVELSAVGITAASDAAIDVLSCTTTMEVGIDIGTLSGVALRNMPPSRASYQQRAGRAGRRGNAVATVVAFGSADSHDEHYFSEPDAMIRGPVDDPVLTLDNPEIAQRHITAFLFQAYHQDKLPEISPEKQPQLFEVLGKVEDFLKPQSALNRQDFGRWLDANLAQLQQTVDDWLPQEIGGSERDALIANIVPATLRAVDDALDWEGTSGDDTPPLDDPGESDDAANDDPEVQPEEGEEQPHTSRSNENLLDHLLYKGVLPRYAFPTDVVAFHVFDRVHSTRFRTEFQYTPSQGLPTALSQYAPGKEVWIDGRLWTSGALYSPMPGERYRAWERRKLYFECSICHYARTESLDDASRGEIRRCPACGADGKFGAAKTWMRPPGFAHPVFRDEGTSPDDQPPHSYATRAKLVAPGPADPSMWRDLNPRVRLCPERTQLLVSNTGPRDEGYTYCTQCGLIEPTAMPGGMANGQHPKPYPDEQNPQCTGGGVARSLVLGTDFISDVLLISIRVEAPLILEPGNLATHVALRTLAEALTLAATRLLEIEPSEVQAEYRPALTLGGQLGLETEIYIYDTLAGGAGFARRIGELGVVVFDRALEIMEGCPAACDRACYRCLRSFRNRFEHDLLDRFVGASLLRYLLTGDEPRVGPDRLDHACERLFADLERQGIEGVSLQRNVAVEIPGIGTVTAPILAKGRSRELLVGVHGPLTPGFAPDAGLRQAQEYGAVVPVQLVDELVVARNLPAATTQVLGMLGV